MMSRQRRESSASGFINVKLCDYHSSTQQYEIEIDDAILLTSVKEDGRIRLMISAKHVNQLQNNGISYTTNEMDKVSSITSSIGDCNNMDESEIDHVLDEILETDNTPGADSNVNLAREEEVQEQSDIDSANDTEEEDDGSHSGHSGSFMHDENQYLFTLKKKLELINNIDFAVICM